MIPDGRVAQGWRFEVETTTPVRSLIQQHFGARRFAYNWALAQVKANLDARAADPSVPALAWTLPTLRKAWNQSKGEVAPWWPSCSKDTHACGIADLVAALHAWSASKQGRRAGSPVRFPRFKARHRDSGRVRRQRRVAMNRPASPHPPRHRKSRKEPLAGLYGCSQGGPGAVVTLSEAKAASLSVARLSRTLPATPAIALPLLDRLASRRVGGDRHAETASSGSPPAPLVLSAAARLVLGKHRAARRISRHSHETKLAAGRRAPTCAARHPYPHHPLARRTGHRGDDLDVAAMTVDGRRPVDQCVPGGSVGSAHLAYKRLVGRGGWWWRPLFRLL